MQHRSCGEGICNKDIEDTEAESGGDGFMLVSASSDRNEVGVELVLQEHALIPPRRTLYAGNYEAISKELLQIRKGRTK